MGKFVISNAVFTNQLCIFSDLTELDINGENNFKKLLIQRGGRFDKFPVISTLKLRGNLSGFLHFSFSSIDYLEFRALNCGADLHMQTGTCERLFFEYFVVNDKGSFKLHDLKSKAKDSVAKFLFCTFDKTIFRNCNFDSYTTFQICASPLDDIVCHGVHWNFKALSTSKREKASYYSAVSKLYENNGNVSRSAQFKAKYFNESLKLPWKNRKLDNTTLFVSKLISNHCTNWLGPAIISILGFLSMKNHLLA